MSLQKGDFNQNLIYKHSTLLRYNLQLFANDEGGEKTEDATPKKLKEAREEGQVAKSTELNTAVMLFALFLVLKIYIGSIGNQFIDVYEKIYGSITLVVEDDMSMNIIMSLLGYSIKTIILIALPIFLVGVVVGFLVDKVQIKWKVTTKPLKPKLSKLDPIKGFKKMFSKEKLVQLLFSLLKIILIGVLVYDTLKDQWGLILSLYDFSLFQAIGVIGSMVISLGMQISSVFLVIGFADLFYQRMKFKKDMKMSKKEVKDEWKNAEGDPHIKGKIKSKMLEASRRRMMSAIPNADVVITNPTHFAVALQYDRESGAAPVVVAKGADFMAQKIKDIAKENKVEIVENKPLARMLYFNVEIDQEIPQELYQMVAEILAYVYRIKNKI
ncbi:flagellar biosynthesis protein FlhB [Anaerosporobacter sp.]|uniref:flagellar biosynthesis protein FlhB n=1 Tax=Anaerosporobacter sp. TaxID=1872529 RepID=UPI0025F3A4CC|nr:flagellar biosynthesis protein FlhB [Anaerosporobacter sp.]